jgi:lysozyme
MSAIYLAVARLKLEEGFRATKYVDEAGKTTIGYGFNIDAGMIEQEAAALLEEQVIVRASQIGAAWFTTLDDVRASVVLDLAFNLGLHGLMQFKDMIAAIAANNWRAAHDALLDSQAARALPNRYNPLAQLLLNGG